MNAVTKFCLICIFILSSCATVEYPYCVRENMHNLTISWGNHDMATGSIVGYKLDAYGNLYSLKRDSSTVKYVYGLIKTLPDTLFCTINEMTIKEILKSQSLNSAIDIERFVEYRNPDERVLMRASWNPKYETKGNKGFMVLYDYLSKIIEENN